MDRCKGCSEDLGNKLTITAILGELICNSCAAKKYSVRKLQECAEEVVPADIGIEAHECFWCGDECEELHKTNIGYLCGTCVLAIQSRGEELW